MHDPDPLDFARLRVDPTKFRPRPKGWRRLYVHVPWAWVERLQSARHKGSVYPLALLLIYEAWKSGGRPIVLSNLLAAEIGILRRAKWNALRELERLDLIKIERGRNRAPRVVVHQLREGSP